MVKKCAVEGCNNPTTEVLKAIYKGNAVYCCVQHWQEYKSKERENAIA